MRRVFLIVAVLGMITGLHLADVVAANDNCVECHSEWEEGDEAATIRWPYDVHNRAGLTCMDCHGGDPTLEDMDEVRASRGYSGVPDAGKIPELCGRCHSDAIYMKKYNPSLPIDQLAKYETSRHGVLLEKGDNKVATCVSCHSVHNIGPSGSPISTIYPINLPLVCAGCHSDVDYMAEYGIPTDQYDKFVSSVHGEALLVNEDIAAPACNDCHGNHGATPPGVENISAVCGLCHAKISMLFAESPHKAAFDENDLPQCETCHSNHNIVRPIDEMIGQGPNSFCIDCHSEGDDNKGFAMAVNVSALLDSLVGWEEKALALIDTAELNGMEVDDERFALKDVRSALVESRGLIHSFDIEKIKPELDKGIQLAGATHASGLEIIDEYYFRRKGLGVATIIITLLAIFIWLRIKRFDKQYKNSVKNSPRS